MLKEVKFKKTPPFLVQLEKNGGKQYKVYEFQHLTVIDGLEPKGKKKSYIRHIVVNSNKRYGATKNELTQIAKELLPSSMDFKIKRSFFVKTCSHIYEKQQ